MYVKQPPKYFAIHQLFSQADGEIAELESLEVVVLMTPMKMPLGGHIPVAGKPVFHPEITYGRKGGARSLTHTD